MTFFDVSQRPLLKKGYLSGGYLPQILNPKEDYSLKLDHMGKAYILGMKGAGFASPNPSVGCVITCQDTVIARGYTQSYGGQHGEKVAFEDLGHIPQHLWEKCQIYVTLEPCHHYGKQPPCTDLFVGKPIQKIFISRKDPFLHELGIQKLKDMGIPIDIGQMQNETTGWHLPFLFHTLHKKPLIALKWAQSLDGYLVDYQNKSQWISGSQSSYYTHWLRQKYDAIFIGGRTLIEDIPKLTARYPNGKLQRQPLRMVYDPLGDLFHRSNPEFHQKLKSLTLTETSPLMYFILEKNWDQQSPLSQTLRNSPQVQIMMLPEILNFKDHIHWILNAIPQSIQSIMVEGGTRIHQMFLSSGLANIMHIFIAPMFLRNGQHPYEEPQMLTKACRHKLLAHDRIGEDMILEYAVSSEVTQLFEENTHA